MEVVLISMDIQEVLRILPHRYPFLLIDKVVEFEKDKRLLALITNNFSLAIFR